MNIENSQREVVWEFPGMTFSPRFSPDGQKVVMSLSQGAETNLYTMDLRSRSTTRLTDTAAIDTSPCYSPDGTRIVFESDRGGTQQIYVMGAHGGDARRISFGGGRYSTPVWSPKGDYIAFTKQDKGNFAIGVMKTNGATSASSPRASTTRARPSRPMSVPDVLSRRAGAGGPKIHMVDVFRPQRIRRPDPRLCERSGLGAAAGLIRIPLGQFGRLLLAVIASKANPSRAETAWLRDVALDGFALLAMTACDVDGLVRREAVGAGCAARARRRKLPKRFNAPPVSGGRR